MIRAGFILALLFVTSFSYSQNKGQIRASLKLKTIKGKDGCRNIFVKLSVQNYGADAVYIDRFKPAVLTIRKRKDNGEYNDYTSKWLYSELQIAEQFENSKVEHSTNIIYDPLSGQFVDSIASQFFLEAIKTKGMYLRTRSDSMELKGWTRAQFEGILYLKPSETWEFIESINSLPSGEYMISFRFSNSKPDDRFHAQELLKKLDLKLPYVIGAYRKWTGSIEGDNWLIEID